MRSQEKLYAAWKLCLSFRKGQWELNDYPVVIREQKTDLDVGDQYRGAKLQRYLARIVNWWVLTGGGAQFWRFLSTLEWWCLPASS